MKRLVSRPHPIAKDLLAPLALTILLCTTPTLFACDMSGPMDLAHRDTQPSGLGDTHGLLAATVSSLQTVTPTRASRLVKAHQAAGTLHPTQKDEEPPLLPVIIRTDSADLIVAAKFLIAEIDTPPGAGAQLRNQLRRFDVSWQLISPEAEELLALRQWATTHFVPGRCTYRDGPTLADCSASVRTFEDMDEPRGEFRSGGETDETEVTAA